ncbi:MAG: TaqI-like C-terminal specificity domain-containing protein, partial [bacterium]
NWQDEFINIPNDIFSNNESSGILDIFDLYNFTIDENTPDDQEVSVDPEMLGKVFENLLEDNVRKGQGAFYTPREIVQYMCRESLINYLASNHSNLSEKNIREYVGYGEALSRDISELKEVWKGGSYAPGQFKELDDLLKNAKIVDPACGSGAFLVGMLQEIIRLRVFLQLTPDSELFLKSPDSIKELSVYELKKETIQNSLYGVDIDPGAVDIAKLRFWLSIVVEEDVDEVEPLPNLDYKIMQGNSLLEDLVIGDSVIKFDFSGGKKMDKRTKEQKELFKLGGIQGKLILDQSDSLTDKLEKLHAEFFSISDPEKKKILKRKIDNIEDELIQSKCHEEIKNAESFVQNSVNDSKKILKGTEKMLAVKGVLDKWKKDHLRPFFPWKLHFGEIFNRENGGFDIAIGNPPYFQLQKNRTISDTLSLLSYRTFSKSADIYCIFYERGIQLLRSNGVLTYITSNSWMKTKYGKALRELFVSMANPIILINFDKSQIFESAIVESNILVLRKEAYNASLHATNFGLVGNDKTMDEYFNENFKIIKNLDSNGWIIGDDKSAEIRLKLEAISEPLGKYNQKIRIGLLNGFNDAYVINTKIKDELILKDPKSVEIIKPMLRGRDVKKYAYEWSGLWMINSHNGLRDGISRIDVEKNYPAIYDHLLKYKEKLEIRKNKGSHWTNLRNCAYFEEFDKPKIIWGELSDSPKFAFDENGFIAEATLFAMIGDNLKFLLGILNSRLALWYFEQITTSSGMGTNRWKKYKIEQFPIRKIDDSNKHIMKEIEIVVERILTENKSDINKQLLNDVDQLIYKLYELTSEEIEIVENYHKK